MAMRILAVVLFLGGGLMFFGSYSAGRLLAEQTRVDHVTSLGAEVESEYLMDMLASKEQQIAMLSQDVAILKAQATRLDALASRLMDLSGISSRDFDFSMPPSIGEIEPSSISQYSSSPELRREVNQLTERFAVRGEHFDTVLGELEHDEAIERATPRGLPVDNGYVSSPFGMRLSPFDGTRQFHKGVDIASPTGEPIRAVADGTVKFAGNRSGYGNIVEIEHISGYLTRYAHAASVSVETGDYVLRGTTVGHVGSTGRSTGPHVHFEVHKQGEPVNPFSVITK